MKVAPVLQDKTIPVETIDQALSELKFTADGLIPAIAQDHQTGEILMMAWMNAQSIRETLTQGRAVYWSRSRQALWPKGETSGQIQALVDFRIDCDGDTILLIVDQTGVACHTGRRNCFFRSVSAGGIVEIPMERADPDALYGR
jgi:phosphoribosyl-AMP cyclohydrolase